MTEREPRPPRTAAATAARIAAARRRKLAAAAALLRDAGYTVRPFPGRDPSTIEEITE